MRVVTAVHGLCAPFGSLSRLSATTMGNTLDGGVSGAVVDADGSRTDKIAVADKGLRNLSGKSRPLLPASPPCGFAGTPALTLIHVAPFANLTGTRREQLFCKCLYPGAYGSSPFPAHYPDCKPLNHRQARLGAVAVWPSWCTSADTMRVVFASPPLSFFQALWHVDSLRERITDSSVPHRHADGHTDDCMFCALRTLFMFYKYSEESVLPPDTVRKALASLYGEDERFQLSEMDDASEAMEAILKCLHADQIRCEKEQHEAPKHELRSLGMVQRARMLSGTSVLSESLRDGSDDAAGVGGAGGAAPSAGGAGGPLRTETAADGATSSRSAAIPPSGDVHLGGGGGKRHHVESTDPQHEEATRDAATRAIAVPPPAVDVIVVPPATPPAGVGSPSKPADGSMGVSEDAGAARGDASPLNTEDLMCLPPHCPAHAVFGYEFFQWNVCNKCGSSSEPVPGRDFVYRLYVSEVQHVARDSRIEDLSTAVHVLERRAPRRISCPSNEGARGTTGACSGVCHVQRFCLSLPRVFAVSLVWESDRASADELKTTLSMLHQDLDLAKLFDLPTIEGQSTQPPARYRLSGMVMFYGRHYMAFIYSVRLGMWVFFDDGSLKKIGSFREVAAKCVRGHLQPTMLFYEALPDTLDCYVPASTTAAKRPRSPSHTPDARDAATDESGSDRARRPTAPRPPSVSGSRPPIAGLDAAAVTIPTFRRKDVEGLRDWLVSLGQFDQSVCSTAAAECNDQPNAGEAALAYARAMTASLDSSDGVFVGTPASPLPPPSTATEGAEADIAAKQVGEAPGATAAARAETSDAVRVAAARTVSHTILAAAISKVRIPRLPRGDDREIFTWLQRLGLFPEGVCRAAAEACKLSHEPGREALDYAHSLVVSLDDGAGPPRASSAAAESPSVPSAAGATVAASDDAAAPRAPAPSVPRLPQAGVPRGDEAALTRYLRATGEFSDEVCRSAAAACSDSANPVVDAVALARSLSDAAPQAEEAGSRATGGETSAAGGSGGARGDSDDSAGRLPATVQKEVAGAWTPHIYEVAVRDSSIELEFQEQEEKRTTVCAVVGVHSESLAQVQLLDVIYQVNGRRVLNYKPDALMRMFARVVKEAQRANKPVVLTFKSASRRDLHWVCPDPACKHLNRCVEPSVADMAARRIVERCGGHCGGEYCVLAPE